MNCKNLYKTLEDPGNLGIIIITKNLNPSFHVFVAFQDLSFPPYAKIITPPKHTLAWLDVPPVHASLHALKFSDLSIPPENLKQNVKIVKASSKKVGGSSRPCVWEPSDHFVIRRNAHVTKLRQDMGLGLRERWRERLVGWVDYIWRHRDSQNYRLLQSQDDLWLRT